MANRPLTIAIQASALKKKCTYGSVSVNHNDSLTWRGKVRPTALSEEYTVKLYYKYNKKPEVYVVEPQLKLADGEKELPHVFDHGKNQQICTYYTKRGADWTSDKLIADTIIPWISEWLYFYEIWLYTGKWKGGGIHGGNIEK